MRLAWRRRMQRRIRLPVRIESALVPGLLAAALGCGGGGMGSGGGYSLALSLASGTAQVFPGQSSVTVNANLTRSGSTGSVALTVSGLPQGATGQIQSPGSGSSGRVAFNAGTAAPGVYAVTILASDGTLSSTANLSLTVGVSAAIMSGTQGTFSVAMSTSFQPAEWDDQFFTLNP